ncbi:hypothetical protein CC2G_013568 [Coprinopsis cinerea AmutBmut pab1-1]|nr:hypothetical protein CC2G_013568 [Coprinopsis cinerea AmutBmut pab1-1]
MATLSSLPTELISLIIDYIYLSRKGPWKNTIRDLKACSLAWKGFLTYSRPYVFHTIVLPIPNSRGKKGSSPFPKIYYNLAAVLEQNRELRTFVRKLVVKWNKDIDTKWWISSALARLVVKFSQLEDLHVELKGHGLFSALPQRLQLAIREAALVSAKGGFLRRLHLGGLGFPNRALISKNVPAWNEISLDIFESPDTAQFGTLENFQVKSFDAPHRFSSLTLRGFYPPAVENFLDSPNAISFAQLAHLDVRIASEEQYVLTIRLLASSENLRTLNLIYSDCRPEGQTRIRSPSLFLWCTPTPTRSKHSSISLLQVIALSTQDNRLPSPTCFWAYVKANLPC